MTVLPIIQAPSIDKITRYTRKLLRGRPDASDGELKRILRARFLPDWVTDPLPEPNVFVFGLFGYAVIRTYHGMRAYFLLQAMESRFNRAIETADSDRDD
jgi:hypothetical protein